MINQTEELLPEDVRQKLEEEHGVGNVVALKHPDGTVFAFRRAFRQDVSQLRARQKREDDEALERMLRECVVWPGRKEFAEYIARRPLGVIAFGDAFKQAQGDTEPDDMDSGDFEELPEGAREEAEKAGEIFWARQRNGQKFAFRIPRPEQVRRFQAEVRKKNPSALELCLVSPCRVYPSEREFAAYIENNLFAIEQLGDKIAEVGGLGTGATRVGK